MSERAAGNCKKLPASAATENAVTVEMPLTTPTSSGAAVVLILPT